MRISERLQEVLFGAILLIGLLLPLPASEVLFDIRDDWQVARGTKFDWNGLRRDTMYPGFIDGMERFRPNTAYREFRVNALGFRGPDIPVLPEEGVIRIAFIGDSKLLGADLAPEDTIAEQTLARLVDRYPECRFDYALVAGPGWGAWNLFSIMESDVRPLEADVSLLLAVGPENLLQEYERLHPDSPDLTRRRGWLETHFRLAEILARIHNLERERRHARRLDRQALIPDDGLRTAHQDLYASLVDALGSDEVVAVAYRGLLRSDQDEAEQLAHSQPLRSITHGLDGADLAEIYDRMAESLDDLSAQRGWTYIDPIWSLSSEPTNFSDPAHLTAPAIRDFARDAATAIGDRVAQQGHACVQPTNSG